MKSTTTCYLITGANRGLGKAISDFVLREADTAVISLSRSMSTDQHISDRFHFVPIDLQSMTGDEILENVYEIANGCKRMVFVCNASIIGEIRPIGELSNEAISSIIHTNTRPAVVIANYLIKRFADVRIDFVNISSGAAKRPIENWSLYCATKAFCEMFFENLAAEQAGNKNIRVFNINPGVIDTNMQAQIRDADFPDLQRFKSLHEDNNLQTPEEAAQKVLARII